MSSGTDGFLLIEGALVLLDSTEGQNCHVLLFGTPCLLRLHIRVPVSTINPITGIVDSELLQRSVSVLSLHSHYTPSYLRPSRISELWRAPHAIIDQDRR